MSKKTRRQVILGSLRSYWSLKPGAKHPWVIESDSNIPEIKAEVVKIGYKPFAELISKAPEMMEIIDLTETVLIDIFRGIPPTGKQIRNEDAYNRLVQLLAAWKAWNEEAA